MAAEGESEFETTLETPEASVNEFSDLLERVVEEEDVEDDDYVFTIGFEPKDVYDFARFTGDDQPIHVGFPEEEGFAAFDPDSLNQRYLRNFTDRYGIFRNTTEVGGEEVLRNVVHGAGEGTAMLHNLPQGVEWFSMDFVAPVFHSWNGSDSVRVYELPHDAPGFGSYRMDAVTPEGESRTVATAEVAYDGDESVEELLGLARGMGAVDRRGEVLDGYELARLPGNADDQKQYREETLERGEHPLGGYKLMRKYVGENGEWDASFSESVLELEGHEDVMPE